VSILGECRVAGKEAVCSPYSLWLLQVCLRRSFCRCKGLNRHGRFFHRFAAAALDRTQRAVRYDPAYVRLVYPGGDVPADTGVCTDEVIRAYRAVGIDLQKEVHRDRRRISAHTPENGDEESLMRISTIAVCPI
jgi:uncharacterized protein YijF (DUF1287 family)